jgi:hypothetical protein
MRYVKNTRSFYSLERRKNIVEVLVQFADEDPAWIPLETLESMIVTLMSLSNEIKTTR